MKTKARNIWARLTLCRCRTKPYLDHVHRYYHIRNKKDGI